MQASTTTKTPRSAGLALMAAAVLVATARVGTAQAADAPAAPEKVVVKAVARFDFDQAQLRVADRDRLLSDVATMQGVTWQTVTAIGHTDAVGLPAYNDQLALQRARVVRDYLAKQGLPPELLRVNAKGPHAPVADNDSAAGRALNRRTEVVFEGVRMQPR